MILADVSQSWQSVWLAGLTMLGLGGVFSLVLLIASEKLKVKVDPKIEQIHEALPNLDCGACGFAGCASYAKAVAEKPKLIGKCTPGGQKTSEKIAQILNLQISDSGPARRPVVHCRAHTNDKIYRAKYQGIQTCISANALANAQACGFGCLSFGDCVWACKFSAIGIIDGLATLDYQKCTGCGACASACPRNLIEMVPFNYDEIMTVACKSNEDAKTTRTMCKVGCIGCGLCVKKSELFVIKDNLARMNYQQYEPSEQAETAVEKCPTGVIIYLGKNISAAHQSSHKAV